jgi:hypothetical protein
MTKRKIITKSSHIFFLADIGMPEGEKKQNKTKLS